ncbi:DUF3089 domain-containing protein [Sphingobium subterraneum]|uniref:DUF3089 domain-containing protein n=1 Tax=Sphingobium subterraneum TaxID=627688 RepID=A0A841J4H0_9SPHN|nr:DUF3089 domain-containing protein [Sphingobium subterraneum]MBB6123475.1 hypothetical protein [Sphingobium subterraneum]
MPARRFLYIVAGLIVLTLGSAFAYRMWGQHMLAAVMVPNTAYRAPPALTAQDYARADLWIARPDKGAENPALWLPPKVSPPANTGNAAIFFVHPTSYLAPFNTAKWNAPIDDRDSQAMASRFIASQASAFSAAGAIWAPRYQQAHFGAFLRSGGNADKAINAAYRDVAAAFAAFLAANPDGPIILAGHSQGSMHLMRILKEQVAGKPVARRIVAAYIVGWPVSLTADLPALGLPACTGPDQSGCILSWQSFAEPAEPSAILDGYARYPGMTGATRRGTPMLCVNPLTGTPDSAADKTANLGTLAPGSSEDESQLVAKAVPARCGTGKQAGFLLIGEPPQMGPYTLPGNNYHVYDYALFWANVRLDAERRLAAFLRR